MTTLQQKAQALLRLAEISGYVTYNECKKLLEEVAAFPIVEVGPVEHVKQVQEVNQDTLWQAAQAESIDWGNQAVL